MRRPWSSQKITIGVLAVSLSSRALALVLGTDGGFLPQLEFRLELLFMLGTSLLCSLLVFIHRPAALFMTVHALHFSAVVVAAQIVPPWPVAMQLLIALPFMLETATYMGRRNGLFVNTALIVVLALGDLHQGSAATSLAPFVYSAAATVILGISLGALAALLIFFRERLVDSEARIAELNMAVTNLSDANRAFQKYADSIEGQSAEAERNRITRELHDSIGYAMTNVVMLANASRELLQGNQQRVDDLLAKVKVQAQDALQETRRVLYRLRSLDDSRLGLRSLAHLVKGFEAATGVRVELNYGNLPPSFGPQIDEVLFRFIQEGLTNAFRHGQARRVRINLWQTDAEIRASVWDNGTGVEAIDEGIGLRGMRERFGSLEGRIVARNVPDGFQLNATIPFRQVLGARLDPDVTPRASS